MQPKMLLLWGLSAILALAWQTEAFVDPNIVISSVAGALAVGNSFIGYNMKQFLHGSDNLIVKVGMIVNNLSKHTFTDPKWTTRHGLCEKAPLPIGILNGTKEVMTFTQHGPNYFPKNVPKKKSSAGIVSWVISSRFRKVLVKRRLVIMWLSPGRFTSKSKNTLAIGMTKNGHNFRDSFYDDMLNNKNTNDLTFARSEFYKAGGTLVYNDDQDYQIIGTMGSTHKTEIQIYIVPKRKEDFETQVLSLLCKGDSNNCMIKDSRKRTNG